MTDVSKQYVHVLVFYSKISKLIPFEKFNNFAMLNPLRKHLLSLQLQSPLRIDYGGATKIVKIL